MVVPTLPSRPDARWHGSWLQMDRISYSNAKSRHGTTTRLLMGVRYQAHESGSEELLI